MERILLIEDDQALGRGIALALAGEGREIRVAATLAQGRAALGEEEYALVLLDLNLPDGNGLDFLTALRRTSGVPVLILTANDLESDQVAGLELGADDYVTKPFSLEEVVSRIRAILRRTREQVEDDPIIRVGDLEINEDSHDVSRAGHAIDLSPTEYKLLRYLMDNEGRVLSKAQILDHVWQYDWGGDAAIVESYISYLRKKVDGIMVTDDNGEQHKVTPLIETKRGIGYMIREPRVSA